MSSYSTFCPFETQNEGISSRCHAGGLGAPPLLQCSWRPRKNNSLTCSMLPNMLQHFATLARPSLNTTGKCQERASQAKQKESQTHRIDECVLTRLSISDSQIRIVLFSRCFWCIFVVEMMRLGGPGLNALWYRAKRGGNIHLKFTCYFDVQPHCQSFDPSLQHMEQINFTWAERNGTKIVNPWNHWRCLFQCFPMLGRHQSAGSATPCARKS